MLRFHEIKGTLKRSKHLLFLPAGCTEEYADFFMGPVHVEDVAMAHILVFENPSASGRHLCVESISHWGDFAARVAELYPNLDVPKYATRDRPNSEQSLGCVLEPLAVAGCPRTPSLGW
jgi:nucleoside-diphosphate-sugar epimerase